MIAALELERQHDHYLKESADNSDRLLQCFDQLTDEMEARITTVTTSCDIIKAELQWEAEKAKRELAILQAKIQNG